MKPRSCKNMSKYSMSESQGTRAERMARYKEERRKQLASQFGSQSEPQTTNPTTRKNSNENVIQSSGSEAPRVTRSSRLRRVAAGSAQETSSLAQSIKNEHSEKSPPASTRGSETRVGGSRRLERDKSSKRKSNLNRSLNCEEVPHSDLSGEIKHRRRRRRFFPPEVLEQSLKESSSNDDKTRSDTNYTASILSPTPPSPVTASTTQMPRRKSELSIHMENARRGITPSYSEMGKHRSSPKRPHNGLKEKSLKISNTADSDLSCSPSPKELNGNLKLSNKENIKYRRSDRLSKQKSTAINDLEVERKNISKRMDDLTALTKETLVRVERLTNKSRDSPKRSSKTKYSSNDSLTTSDSSRISSKSGGARHKTRSTEKSQPFSILKKKSIDDSISESVLQTAQAQQHTLPVSILKRKVSQDEHRMIDGFTPPSTNTPVTFSPSVIEPSTTKRKQGILKKRRSLDESQVLRHRSYSPDAAINCKFSSHSILKDQRRSSLEDIIRTQSPDSQLQGILKRKSSRTDEEQDVSLNSPQGILKRRSGGSSAGSINNNPHVSITTAVILAAAGGAEMILNSSAEQVRPILKKKSFSDDQSHTDTSISEAPKPILKKKSSTDTDDNEDKPKKPILKAPRNSLDNRETIEIISESRSKSSSSRNDSGSDCDVKPILKQSSSREESPRSRLSFSSDANEVAFRSQRHSRRSHTVCTDFNVNDSLRIDGREEDREMQKPRPLSVSELVMNFEKTTICQSTGAIPKRSNFKRNSDRCRTQPITFNELEASLTYVNTPTIEDLPKVLSTDPQDDDLLRGTNTLLDFTTSLENDANLNNFLLYSFQNASIDSGVGGKMSSDSAFQSLGDGLELEDEEESPSQNQKSGHGKLEPSKLELQMKAIAEEAKSMRLGKGNTGMQKYRNRKNAGSSSERTSARFSTQPVTLDEVQEASRLKKDGDETADEKDPSKLSLSERIKIFNLKVSEQAQQKREIPKRRFARFQTQPVTSEEVETAKTMSPCDALDLGNDVRKSSCERKGILKSKAEMAPPLPRNSPSPPKSVLKKRDSFSGLHESVSPRSILKSDAYDEGISSNDSGSETEMGNVQVSNYSYDSEKYNESYGRGKQVKKSASFKFSADDATYTSDGESSGGREVRSIISRDENRHRLRDRSRHESSLLKSKSQSAFGDDVGRNKKTEIHRSLTQSAMPRAIAELQAKLQQSSDNEWRKRISKLDASDELTRLSAKNLYNEELSEKSSILAARKDELDASLKQWRSRVEKTDAIKFSVAGRMQEIKDVPTIPINISQTPKDKTKRVPQAKRFKGKEGGDSSKDSSSTPVSPDLEGTIGFKRSLSVPGTGDHDSSGSDSSLRSSGRKVTVFRPDDVTFTSFFTSVNHEKTSNTEINVHDFDLVTRESQNLLVQKKNIQVQRRRGKSRNPIKALATRPDIQSEYTEVITGVAEREKRRLNIEKLAKSSNFAVEALAGLASKEDFTSVALKKSRGPTTTSLPYKDLMLLHVKGRRHVQTRLVEPSASSINQGDNFILVTPTVIYNFIGAYSNVIEQSRAADIVNHIQHSNDLGCKPEKVITVNAKSSSATSQDVKNFWKLLGCNGEVEVADAGHPDEDDIYDSGILETNMAYTVEGGELVPLEECWGTVPKVGVLQPTKVIVFDFGTEMYVWSGKNALLEEKKLALKLAKEMWEEGYNYTECSICPINVASVLGSRQEKLCDSKGDSRPDWSLFAKLTQHRETILFREKFLDWPDFSRVIKVKDGEKEANDNASFDIQACNVDKMLKRNDLLPDLLIEGTHLGRGDQYFDEETRRQFEYDTLDVSCWRVLENTHEKLDKDSVGQFYDGDSYILRWHFRMTVMGRELSGKPSKHSQIGRDRTVFFCWQGSNASVNEKGAAALLTVELDNESAPQVCVTQGLEPCAFLKLFKGNMVVHSGKRERMEDVPNLRLFYVRGEVEDEVFLTEVPCDMSQLRSRTSFVLFDCESGAITIWHGSKSSKQTRLVIRKAVDGIVRTTPIEFQFDEDCQLEVCEIEEGEEMDSFLNALGENRRLYLSLSNRSGDFDYNLRLFHLSSLSGTFEATEILCPHRSNYVTPYPFLQSELYSASQPALFMLDNGKELWLWQGWWPDREEDLDSSDQTGSGAIRWQIERRAAMKTAVNYWQRKTKEESPSLPIYLVWAGLEPLAFTNLFPTWINKEDIAELNIKEGKKSGGAIPVEKELAILTRSTYPLAELLERPLPEGVDPRNLEMYLSSDDFKKLLCMSPEEFRELPTWKKAALKKEKGLF